jgi:hypothetical protein
LKLPYITLIWAYVFAVFFYKVGDMEYRKGYVSCLASIAFSMVSIFVFKFGWKGLFLLQVFLFCVLWGYNIYKDEKPKSLEEFKSMWRKNEKD